MLLFPTTVPTRIVIVQYVGDCSKDDAEAALGDCIQEFEVCARVPWFGIKLKCAKETVNVCPPGQSAALESYEMFGDVRDMLVDSKYTPQLENAAVCTCDIFFVSLVGSIAWKIDCYFLYYPSSKKTHQYALPCTPGSVLSLHA